MRRLLFSTTTLLLASAMPARAQGTTAADSGAPRAAALPRPANDSLFRRARRLVSEGSGAAGRALVDSLLRAADPATAAYGNALYWHGALAPTAAEAERDYRRVIVEYPLAFYADDALLAIAELEQARGDRAGALQHLQRFVREHPVSPARGVAALGAARLAFEQRDTKLGCAMIADARTSADPQDVELRNQIDYYGGRCSGASVADAQPAAQATPRASERPAPAPSVPAARPAAPVATSKPPAPAAAKASARPAASPRPAVRSSPRAPTSYTIQVAAYNTRPDAERLVKKLVARGVKARVSGTSAPFRVRLELYRTRKEAADEVLALQRRGIVGFVTEEARPAETRSP
jgi:cell division protein FtsN